MTASPPDSLLVNGQPRPLPAGGTIAALLAELQLDSRYLAVEQNLRLIPRAQHAQQRLAPGDSVEIVTLVGGG